MSTRRWTVQGETYFGGGWRATAADAWRAAHADAADRYHHRLYEPLTLTVDNVRVTVTDKTLDTIIRKHIGDAR